MNRSLTFSAGTSALVLIFMGGWQAVPALETTPFVVLQKIGPVRLLANVPREKGLLLVKFSGVFELAVEVDGDRGLEVEPPPRWIESAGWKIKNLRAPTVFEHGAGWRWRQTFDLDPTGPTVATLQLQPLRYRNADGRWHNLDPWQPLAVKVEVQMQAADPKSLREHPTVEEVPAPPPSEFPWEWLSAALLTGSVLLMLILVFWLRRRGVRSARTRTCEKIALYELKRLDALALPDKGRSGEFHTLLANVVRRYLEKRYRIPARRLTTQEFSSWLEETTVLTAANKDFLKRFLRQCDLAKFTLNQVSGQECRELHRETQEFLRLAASGLAPESPALSSR